MDGLAAGSASVRGPVEAPWLWGWAPYKKHVHQPPYRGACLILFLRARFPGYLARDDQERARARYPQVRADESRTAHE